MEIEEASTRIQSHTPLQTRASHHLAARACPVDSIVVLTQLGEVQEYGLGQLLRSLYFTNESESLIQGISTGLVDGKQVEFRADAGVRCLCAKQQ